MSALRAFVELSRPHFLVGGLLLYALGAFRSRSIIVEHYILGQALVTSIQLTAQYVNEYADLEADRLVTNRTMFSGGSGVLTSGRLQPRVALGAALTSTIVAMLLIVVVATISTFAAIVAASALATSWAYSMRPVRLLDTGWGELASAITVVGLVPIVGVSVHDAPISASLWWSVAVLVALQMAMLLAFELPDLESDRVAGKTVLAVRIGRTKTEQAITALYTIAGVIGIAAAFADQPDVMLALGAAAIPATVTVLSGRKQRYRLLTVSAVAAQVAFLIVQLALL